MEILYTLPRHREQIEKLQAATRLPSLAGPKYIVVAIDDVNIIDRKASFASDFNYQDTHKLFQALADQTK